MTIEEFGRVLQTKSVGRIDAPDNEQLTMRVYSAMIKIGHDTTPLKWMVETKADQDIMRRIDEFTYIRKPKMPQIGSGTELDIEPALIDALALLIMAGLEQQRSKINMGMYWGEIDQYNFNLIETHLSEASNDSSKFHSLP